MDVRIQLRREGSISLSTGYFSLQILFSHLQDFPQLNASTPKVASAIYLFVSVLLSFPLVSIGSLLNGSLCGAHSLFLC